MTDSELRLPSPRVAWVTFGFTLAGTLAFVVVDDAVRSVLLVVSALVGIVGMSAGATWVKPRVRWPWYGMSTAGALFLVGAVLRAALTNPDGVLHSTLPDSFTLPGYAVLGASLIGLLRARRADADRATITDAVVVGAAATLVAVAFLVEPTLAQHTGSAVVHLVSSVYPPIDVLLLLIVLQLAFTDVSGAPSFWFLTMALTAIWVGDTGYAIELAGIAHPYARLLDTPYVLAYGGLATAALHPSMWLLSDPQRRAVRPMTRWRLLTVTLAVGSPVLVTLCRPPELLRDRILYATALAVLVLAVFVRSVRAVNEHAASETHLSLLATRDPLTGLANRNRLSQFLTDELPRAAVANRRLGLVLLDLDRFQVVNDNWGHGVGDELLVAVAERLLHRLPDTLVVRTSGDEFVVASTLTEEDADGSALTARVMAAFEQVFEVSTGQLTVNTSAGLAVSRRGRTTSAETMLRDADTAMHRAKSAGGARCVRFEPQMHAAIAERVAIEQRLRRAVAGGGLELHYQPIVALTDGVVRGFEALLRMRPDGTDATPLRPDEFIPVAESTGLILQIGSFVLDRACRQIAEWRADPSLDMADVFVAVNVSSRQLHEHTFVAEVLGALERHGVPAHCLHIEITESLLMDDVELASEMLDSLRGRGVHISVDDFGTGHSSLGYLKRLPVGTVKIDRSFVRALGDADSAESGDDEVIVRAVMGMAKALNLSVVAEGVETAGQRDALRTMGCPYAQGWLYGRPMVPADAARAWQDAHRPHAFAS